VVESFMVATATEDLPAHAARTAGTWPQAPESDRPIPVAIPAALDAKLDLGIGGELRLGKNTNSPTESAAATTFTVVGLYQPDSTADQYWELSPVGTATTIEYGVESSGTHADAADRGPLGCLQAGRGVNQRLAYSRAPLRRPRAPSRVAPAPAEARRQPPRPPHNDQRPSP
jgi:hypothetical protein